MTRHLAMLVLGALLVFVLGGCVLIESSESGPVAIRRDGEAILIAPCTELFVSIGWVTINPADGNGGEAGRSREIREFRDFAIAADTVLSTDPTVTPPAPGENTGEPNLKPEEYVQVILTDRRSTPERGVVALFRIPKDGLSDALWQHRDGSLTEEPCPGEI